VQPVCQRLILISLNDRMIGAWLGFAVGIVVVMITLSGVVGTLVVPRAINSRISRAVDRGLDVAFLLSIRVIRSFEQRPDPGMAVAAVLAYPACGAARPARCRLRATAGV
jgi:hypothetical protein